MLKNVVKIDKEKLLFQLFFLRDDENQSVEVEEVDDIDFKIVKKRLEEGESVFITRKSKQELNKTLGTMGDAAEAWYFNRI